MAKLNKKILCFVDEYGTAGDPGFALGSILVWSRYCGRADKAFSDILEPNVNEIHAAKMNAPYLQGLLAQFKQTQLLGRIVMLNKLGTAQVGTRPEIYALNIIETVKTGIRQFAKANNFREKIGNVDLILDVNHQNEHPEFDAVIEKAKKDDGRFRSVNRVVRLDSAASRILQLTDVVAHARTWIHNSEQNAEGLRRNYGITLI